MTGANTYPWVVGGTPPVSRMMAPTDSLSGYGNEIGPNTSGVSSPATWESLLNFDSYDPGRPFEAAVPLVKLEGESVLVSPQASRLTTPSKKGIGLERSVSSSEAWRLALNRTVDVEGAGRVGVARILSEVWKRGGPVAVSAMCAQ